MADHIDPIAELMSAAADPTPATPLPSSSTSSADRPGQVDACTDLANGRRFAADHRNDARYSHPEKSWYVWDGRRWRRDESGAAVQLAKQTATELLAHAARKFAEARDPLATAEATRLLKWAVASQQANRIGNMLEMARSEPGISITPQQLDANPWLLNTLDGTVDLRTGEKFDPRREDLITALAPHPFDPSATCPTWDRFLQTVFGRDRELIGYIRRFFGYSCTGDTSTHVLPVLWGSGSNGKSVLITILLAVLGVDYAGRCPPDLLLARKGNQHPTELADLKGKRLLVAVETEEGRRLNEALVKELTGGDRIKARRLYQDFFEFDPTHKLAICTNHKPKVRAGGHGIWRRLALVAFSVKFWNSDKGETGQPELQADRELPEKLLKEATGILAWLVAGAAEWYAAGRSLGCPKTVLIATKDYQTEEDTVRRFISEECVKEKSLEVKAKDVFAAYLRWCEAEGESPVSRKKFGTKVQEEGAELGKSHGDRTYVGIGLGDDQRSGDDQRPNPGNSPTHARTREVSGNSPQSSPSSPDHPQPAGNLFDEGDYFGLPD